MGGTSSASGSIGKFKNSAPSHQLANVSVTEICIAGSMALKLLENALEIVRRDRKCSTSYIQRKLSIGYNRAAKIVEALEEKGFVSPANHVGKRDVLIPENNI